MHSRIYPITPVEKPIGKNMKIIGIDPGVKTGIAIWDDFKKDFICLGTISILRAMDVCLDTLKSDDLLICFEDARQRKWFGNKGREALQGAGSIKRDCSIWQEFCEYHSIPYKMIAPQKGNTKLSAEQFKKLTGWKARTSEHARDAAMLVYGK